MPMHFQQGASGQIYEFNISGIYPTEQEQQRINSILTDKFNDAPVLFNVEESSAPSSNAIMRGLSVGTDQMQLGFGSAIEGIGKVTGIEGLEKYGQEVIETNKADLAVQPALKTWEEVDGVGDFFTYFGEQLGSTALQMAGTVGASIGGGAVAGPAGAIAGGMAFNVPYFYGQNREAQKQAVEQGYITELDEGAAILSAVPQAALDYVMDRFLVGLGPGKNLLGGGGLLTRGVKNVATGAITEAPTEIGQQFLERLQAGKPLADEEALREYYEAGVAGGLIGGTVRGTTGIIGGDPEARRKKAELEQDGLEEMVDASEKVTTGKRVRSVEEISNAEIDDDPVAERDALDLNPQERTSALAQVNKELEEDFKPVPLSQLPEEEAAALINYRSKWYNQSDAKTLNQDASLQEIADVIGGRAANREARAQKPMTFKSGRQAKNYKRTFRWSQYERAVNAVAKLSGKNVTLESIRDAVRINGKKAPIRMARDIRDEMIADGIITVDNGRHTLTDPEKIKLDPTRELKQRKVEYERKLEAIQKDIAKYEKQIEESIANDDAVMADAATKKRDTAIAQVKRINDEVLSIDQQARAYDPRTKEGKARRKALDDMSRAKAEALQFTQGFQAKIEEVRKNIKARLKQIGITKDLDLKTDAILAPEMDALVEGYLDTTPDGKLVMALSTGIYDPSKSADELTDAIMGVVNHESIHALRKLGLFSEQEWNSLTKAVKSRKYVKMSNGELQERGYTYYDRAKRDYTGIRGYDEDSIVEEAVAEMFRDYADGKINVGGNVKTLLDRIKDFFAAIFRANADAGFDTPESIFANIESGTIGMRDRKPLADVRGSTETSLQDVVDTINRTDRKYSQKQIKPAKTADQSELMKFVSQLRNSDLVRLISAPENAESRVKMRQVISSIAEQNGDPEIARLAFAVLDEMPLNTVEQQDAFIASVLTTLRQLSGQKATINKRKPFMKNPLVVDGEKMPDSRISEREASILPESQVVYKTVDEAILPEDVASLRDEIYEQTQRSLEPFGRVMTVYRFGSVTGEAPQSFTTNPRVLNKVLDEGAQIPAWIDLSKPKLQLAFMVDTADVISSPEALAQYPEGMDAQEIIVRPSNVRQRRFSLRRLTPEQRDLTVVDLYKKTETPNDPNPFERTGERNRVKLTDALEALQQLRGNVVLEETPENLETIATLMAAEAEAALINDPSAIGWYDAKLKQAKQLMAIMHPEILTDPQAEHAMDFAIAVTSNGLSVVDNFGLANEVYEGWRQSGRFPEKTQGKQGQSMIGAFRLYNALLDSGLSETEVKDLLSYKVRRGDLLDIPVLAKLGIKPDSKETVNAQVHVSYILGPKIGEGFYQNLRGNYDALTMDRWWMRFYNRITGRPFEEPASKTIAQNITDFLDGASEPVEADLAYLNYAMEATNNDMVSSGTASDLAIEITNEYQRDRARANKNGQPIPEKTPFILAAERLAKNTTLQAQESPRTAKQRQYMRDATRRATQILEEDLGVKISMSDFQALMWYAEKNLLLSAGVRPGKGDTNDYVDGVITLLRKKGFADERIAEALPDSERYRLGLEYDVEGRNKGFSPRTWQDVKERFEVSRPEQADVRFAETQLLDLIKNNPDGFTVTADADLEWQNRGYPVAPIKPAEIVIDADQLTPEVIADFVDNIKILSDISGKPVYAGGWLNSADGKYYLDATIIEDSKTQALLIAEAGNQEGIFDLGEMNEIRTPEAISRLEETGTYSSKSRNDTRANIAELTRRFREAKGIVEAEPEQVTVSADQAVLDSSTRVSKSAPALSDPFDDLPQEMKDTLAEDKAFLDGQVSEDVKYSQRPIKQYAPVPAPVAGKKVNHHGFVVDSRGKPSLVILTAGAHYSRPEAAEMIRRGEKPFQHGLYHIRERGHEKEIVAYSDYDSASEAIFDLLNQWRRQNFEEDEKGVMIKDQSRRTQTLTWVGRNPRSRRPITVAMEEMVSSVDGKSRFYVVKTAYVDNQVSAQSRVPAAGFVSGQPMLSYRPTTFGSVQLADNANSKIDSLLYSASSNTIARVLGFAVRGAKKVGFIDARAETQQVVDDLLQKFQDSMLPVGRMIDELRAKGLNITDAMDTYMREELYNGVVGARLEKAQKDLFEPLLRVIKDIALDGAQVNSLMSVSSDIRRYIENSRSKDLGAVEMYLYALHAKERNAAIRKIDKTNEAGSGMSDADADRIIAWVESLPQEQRRKMELVRSGVRDIVRRTNEIRVNEGLVSPDDPVYFETDPETQATEPVYQDYVPLRGFMDEENELSDMQGGGGRSPNRFGVRGKEDISALGRSGFAVDLLGNVFVQHQRAIDRGERNKVGDSFLQILEADPELTSGYAEVLERGRARRVLNKNGYVSYAPDPRFKDRENILIVKRGGQEIIIDIKDPRIAMAMKGSAGLSPKSTSALFRSLANINRYLSNINTSYNPEFFITNFVRDLSTGLTNINQYDIDEIAKSVVKNVPSALKGLKQAIRDGNISGEWGAIYQDFVDAGGKNATNMVNSVADQMADIDTLLGDISEDGIRGAYNKMKNSFAGEKAGSLLRFLEDYNTVVENGIRVATYKALLDKGFTRERAAQAARNVTVNFAKGGEYKTFMNSMYLFYNASLQGTFALLNAAVRSPKVRKIWMGAVVLGFLQDQLNALASDEDDDGQEQYDKIPDYVLEHNLIIPTFGMLGDRSYITIPLPYGLNMATNLGRASSRFTRGAATAGETASSIVGTAIDTINPLGGTESFANFAAPTVIDPFIDIIENRDFADKPIYKEQGQFGLQKPDSQLFWSTTSPSSKWLASTLNSVTGGSEVRPGFVDISPDTIDYWFGYLTGGIGRFTERVGRVGFTALSDPAELFSEGGVRNIPFARKLVGSVSSREDTELFIKNRDNIMYAYAELKDAVQKGDKYRVRKIREDYKDELRVYAAINSLNNARNRLIRQKSEISKNPRINETTKSKRLDRIDEAIQRLTQRANKIMLSIQ